MRALVRLLKKTIIGSDGVPNMPSELWLLTTYTTKVAIFECQDVHFSEKSVQYKLSLSDKKKIHNVPTNERAPISLMKS